MLQRLGTVTVLFFYFTIGMAQNGFVIENRKQKTKINFKWVNNLIVLPVEINGTPLNFVLDTGVESTVLFSVDDSESVEFKDLTSIKIRGIGNKESVDAFSSENNEFRIGDFVDYHHRIYLVLDQEINISPAVGIPINGIIGNDFFKDHCVRIDYVQHQLRIAKEISKLQRRKEKFEVLPLTFIQNKPYTSVPVVFSSQSVNTFQLLDTGNTDPAWFFEPSLKNIECIPKSTIEDYLGKGMSGEIFGRRGRITQIQLGTYPLKRPIVSFPDVSYVKELMNIDKRNGTIGSDILKRFHSLWDYRQQKLWIRANSLYDEPFLYNMSGIEVQHQGMQWIAEEYDGNLRTAVTSQNQFDGNGQRISTNVKLNFELRPIYYIITVRDQSPGALAGVQKGDRLLRIEGKECQHMNLDQINAFFKIQDGKTIELELERNGKSYRTRLTLKDLLP